MRPSGVKRLMLASLASAALIMSMLPAHAMTAHDAQPAPDYIIGGDMIVSYDEPENANDALHPSVAVAPAGSPYEGMIHAVWDELEEASGFTEIHYSASEDGGRTWTHDHDDFIISCVRNDKVPHGNAAFPSVAVDAIGNIHVIWAEQNQNDGTWEMFYSYSLDNGKSWSGTAEDIRISQLVGDMGDAAHISAPKLVIGIPQDKALPVFHAIWSERTYKNDQELIHYSRSTNGGLSWSGQEADDILSEQGQYAIEPDVAFSGPAANYVHLSWTQESAFGFNEIFYRNSTYFGQKGTWGATRPISSVKDDGMMAGGVSFTGSIYNDVHAVWKQFPIGKPYEARLFYSSSFNNGASWSGTEADFPVCDYDGFAPSDPCASVGGARLQVMWTEVDEKSPLGTLEVHTSWNDDPHNPSKWTGLEGDIVLSNGDDWGPADANNVSMQMGINKQTGLVEPVFVWDELNDEATKSFIDRSTEIHTEPLPEWTLTVSVSGSGTVTKAPDQATYTDGTWVTLTANPAFGWTFDHWGGDLVSYSNPGSIQMDSDKYVTAFFTQNVHYESLVGGWNLVSLPYVQADTSAATVLASISGSYECAKWFNAQDSADPWKSYRQGGTANDLTSIDHRMAVWIKATGACTLTVYGNIPSSTSITLYTGWNLVGYPSQTSRLASATLPSAANIVSVFKSTAPYVTDYTDKTLVTMSQGNGYWVHVTADVTWTVAW